MKRKPAPVEKLAFSVDEFAAMFSVCRTSVYKMHNNNELKFIKVGGRTLVPKSEIERLKTAYYQVFEDDVGE